MRPCLPLALAALLVCGCDADPHLIGRFLPEPGPSVGPSVTPPLRPAPPADAGVGDAGSLGGTRCPKQALLCEGFDVPFVGDTDVEDAASLTTTTERAVAGAGSLLSVADFQQFARARLPIAPRDSGEVHLRVYLLLDDGPPTSFYTALFGFHYSAFDKLAVDLRPEDTASIVGPTVWAATASAVPRARWSCWQLSARLSRQEDGWARLKVDGRTIAEATGVVTAAEQPYSEIWVGIEWVASNPGPLRLYTDELAYGNVEQPCDLNPLN